jgi:hypothetical protein
VTSLKPTAGMPVLGTEPRGKLRSRRNATST